MEQATDWPKEPWVVGSKEYLLREKKYGLVDVIFQETYNANQYRTFWREAIKSRHNLTTYLEMYRYGANAI